jgi:type VI secretion system protein ImpM
MNTQAVQVGFFGKIPTRGDFVQAGLSRSFTRAWDDWARRVLFDCLRLIGDGWDSAWREAPAWRFALPAGQCGSRPVLGLFVPSVDGAGRKFPLMIAAEGAANGSAFLDAAQKIAGEAVGGALAPDALLARLTGLNPPAPATGNGLIGCWWHGEHRIMTFHSLPDSTALIEMLRR